MNKYLLYSFLFLTTVLYAQEEDTITLNFKEYLGFVKKHHPVAKQAELNISVGEANLLKSRGGFDPKIEVDYDRKKFKGDEYYDLLNATFKVPTWYGIELKANFEQNEGVFLNEERTVPDDGLYSAGISVPIAQGLLINDRMASLRKARLFREQTKADRDLLVNEILYDASLAYFDWLEAFNEKEIYQNFLTNARMRFEGVKKSALAGDKAIIDTVEAKITVQNRQLSLEQAKVKLMKSTLDLSNYLWIGNNIPVELQPNVIPDNQVDEVIDKTLQIQQALLTDVDLVNHPKLRSLNYKIEGLEIDRRLKANKLLPKINLEYNFITASPEVANSFNTADYKGGVTFQFPLFLRKERGAVKLAKYKIQDSQYELASVQLQIENKVNAIYNELESFKTQNGLIANIVNDYTTLLKAEERKFSFGESSLFLINSRESKLIDAELKSNKLQNKYFSTKAKLFKNLAVNPENL
ncbi:TolC family protein [Aquimarina sp. BL5]|uniref:TolC family protein n=1 Tax=Aquimarina sp. BL5 TaxID=1714860 RepID=UPI000E4DA169|nr:TolC family protein [Aquimarina sp. BL5]AXT52841.1 TolC family protein [Aquimarina sp. BL5]RKN08829.1 TolC family protein [Aquimarina sp. BL5]